MHIGWLCCETLPKYFIWEKEDSSMMYENAYNPSNAHGPVSVPFLCYKGVSLR